jgi:hypothetical protein
MEIVGYPAPLDSEVSLCHPCYSIGGQGINQLLNYILNVGVIGGCGSMCAAAIPAGGAVAIACELVCSAVGVKAFIAAIEKADLDPIYFCEVVRACPKGPDDAYLELIDIAASPAVVAKGDDIKMAVELNVTNQTGVGEFSILINGPGTATPLSQGFFLDQGIPAGDQMLAVTLTLKDGTDDQGFPATFEGGEYNFTFHVCQGSCGSTHPHSKDFGLRTGTFFLNGSAPTPPPPPPQDCDMQMDEDSCKGTADPFDPMSGACQWCEDWFTCQSNAFPCAGAQVV